MSMYRGLVPFALAALNIGLGALLASTSVQASNAFGIDSALASALHLKIYTI